MGIKRLVREKKVDPCDLCKYEHFRQVEQFEYEHYCKKGMPQNVFYRGVGCFMFKKRKGDKPS